jgi:transketolase
MAECSQHRRLHIEAAASLRGEGRQVRVVSIPCIELFEEQDTAYRKSVLPAAVHLRVVVEASSSFEWHKYTGFDGAFVSIDRFGALSTWTFLCAWKNSALLSKT